MTEYLNMNLKSIFKYLNIYSVLRETSFILCDVQGHHQGLGFFWLYCALSLLWFHPLIIPPSFSLRPLLYLGREQSDGSLPQKYPDIFLIEASYFRVMGEVKLQMGRGGNSSPRGSKKPWVQPRIFGYFSRNGIFFFFPLLAGRAAHEEPISILARLPSAGNY